MTVPFTYNFLKTNFHILLPKLGYFSQKKGNLKFSDTKMQWRYQKMSHFRNTSNLTVNFRKSNTEALVISERLNFPQDDQIVTNFKAPFRMHFQISKRTLDSLKSVFNVFRRSALECLQNVCDMKQVPETALMSPSAFTQYCFIICHKHQ